MLRTACDTQRVLDDNRRLADMISAMQRNERHQASDIESLKKRLEKFSAENDDLLEKIAAMKRDRACRQRQFDEQMKEVADKLQALEDDRSGHPDNDQLREVTEQLETARRNVDRLQQELDMERGRVAELERVNVELQSRLDGNQTTQPAPVDQPPPAVENGDGVQRERQLEDQVRALTKQLADANQQLEELQTNAGNYYKQEIERLTGEKAELEQKNRELSLSLNNLKRDNAINEQQEQMLREQLEKLKRTLEACSEAEEELKKQLQRVVDKNQELEQLLEQMRAEQSGAKRTEKMLREEIEKMKQADNERAIREAELKRQLEKAQEDYETLNRKTQSEIQRLKDESKRRNEEVDSLKKANLQLQNNERQMKAELEEAKREAENGRRKLQQEIDRLRADLQASEEACNKLRKERDEMLEKWVPKERLEEAEAELKELKKSTEEAEMRIKKMQDEYDALERKLQEKEQELKENIEKLRFELKTKEEQLEEAAQKLQELDKKIEKMKQSFDEKEKLLKKEHEKLKQAMKEQQKAFQEKLKAKEVQHLVEKEHMLKLWKEKEQELKNQMKAKELEIRTEIDELKAKCEQLQKVHEEKLKEKEEETKGRIKKLKDEIEAREKLVEEVNEKNKELQKIIDEHVSQTNELQALRSGNGELTDKVGKLERAVVRLRLENDELREYKIYNRKDGNVKSLVSEQTAHISDLQLQVDMLRQALKDLSKSSPRRGLPPIDSTRTPGAVDYNGRLLGEVVQLLSTTARDAKRPSDDTSALASQLEAEKSKVRAGSERIAQLEGWLDTIFSDKELGVGPASTVLQTAGNGGNSEEQMTSEVNLPPVDGISDVAVARNTRTKVASRRNDRLPNRQKQKLTSRSKRQ